MRLFIKGKKGILLLVCMVLSLIMVSNIRIKVENPAIEIIYSDMGNEGLAQLFWAPANMGFSQENSETLNIKNNRVYFELDEYISQFQIFRIDPYNGENKFTIKEINLYKNGKKYISIYNTEIEQYYEGVANISETNIEGDGIAYYPLNNDVFFIMNQKFNDTVCSLFQLDYDSYNVWLSVLILFVYLIIVNHEFFEGKIQNIKKRFFGKIKDETLSRMSILTVWLVLMLVLFGEYIFGDAILSPSNLMYEVAPWKSLDVETEGPSLSDSMDSYMPDIYNTFYSESEFSLWNSNIAFGIPDGVINLINPLNIIYVLFSFETATLIKIMLEISFAYFGMCYLASRMKLSTFAGILSGIIYSCSSAMIMWLFWAHTDVMALAPFCIAICYNLINKQKIKDILCLGILVFLMLVAGMPTFAAYVMYIIGFFVLIMTIVKYKKDIKSIFKTYVSFGVSCVLGILMSVPYLIGIVNSVVSNGYASSRTYQGKVILELDYIRTMFFPYIREDYDLHINESTLYVGILAIVLLLVGIVGCKKSQHKFWMFSGIIVFVLIFTHWLDFVYTRMPAVNTSLKIRLINIMALIISILVGVSIDVIEKNSQYYKERSITIIRLVIYAVLIVVLRCYSFNLSFEKYSVEIISAWIYLLVSIIFVELLLKRKTTSILISIFIIIAAISELGIFAKKYLPEIDANADFIPVVTDSTQYLIDNVGDYRIYPVGRWCMFPNTNEFYELNYITSHSFINTNDDISRYMKTIDAEVAMSRTNYQGTKIDNYNLLKWSGVKYIVKEAANLNINIVEAEMIYAGQDGLEVYELEQPASKFYLCEEVVTLSSDDEILAHMSGEYKSDKAYIKDDLDIGYQYLPLQEDEKITVIYDDEDYIKLDVELANNRLLVFNEYDADKWNVYIDGVKSDIIRANYLFKGVYLQEGKHTVEFVYENESIINMCTASGVIFIVILVSMCALQLREIYKRKNISEGRKSNEINYPNTML